MAGLTAYNYIVSYYDGLTCIVQFMMSVPALIVTSLVAVLVINFACFLVAFYRQSDKLTDFAYAFSFVVVALTAWLLSNYRSLVVTLAVAMVVVWAFRLGSFLVIRIRTAGHDRRFDAIRGNFFSFLKFWLGQGVVAWLLLLPVLFMLSRPAQLSVLMVFGGVLWAGGLIIESLADAQKFRFRQNSANNGRWIDEGVWHYSRHPNYFGEISIWVGLYIFAFSSLTSLERLVGLVSPLAIFVALRYISGIPILEQSADERWGNDPNYCEYKAATPLLVPRWRAK